MVQNVTRRILVVDDDQIVSDLLREILEKNGYSVDVALDGTSATGLVKKHCYGAIIIDVVLQGPMGGKELYLNLVKTDLSLLDRILFITADTVSENTADFLEETDRPFLYKPFSVPELIDQVQLIIPSNPA